MPTLTGTLAEITGKPIDPDSLHQVTVRAPSRRASLAEQARLVASVPVPVEVSPTGEISVDLEPGPAILLVEGEGLRDTFELGVTEDMTLLTEAIAESAPSRSWVESNMVQLRAEAVEAAELALQRREAAEQAAEKTGLDVDRVEQVRDILEEAYNDSAAGFALPPRLTEAALNNTYADKPSLQRALTSPGVATPRPMLVFVDDDGEIETWTITREIFNAKGVPFVAGVPSGLVDASGYMTLAQVQQLQAEGHEIASHLVEYNVGVNSPQFDLAHVGQSREWFAQRGVVTDHLVWVGGQFNDTVIAEAKKHYTSATSVIRGHNRPPVDQFALRRYAVGSLWNNATTDGILEDGSQAQYNAMVDKAKASNSLVIAMMHNGRAEFDATQQDLVATMIDYALTQGVEIVTMREAMSVFGNALDIGTTAAGHFRVGADGKVDASDVPKVYVNLGTNPAGINNTAPRTAYPSGRVSFATFNSASGAGFPSHSAGTLETLHLSDEYAVRQWWYPFDRAEVWFRQYVRNSSFDEWGPWRLSSFVPTPSVTVSVAAQTIAPGAVVEVRIPHPAGASIHPNQDTLVGVPVGGLETGIMHSVAMWTDKTIIIRLHNTTASTVTTVAKSWRISVLD